jgi:hypothetical protein
LNLPVFWVADNRRPSRTATGHQETLLMMLTPVPLSRSRRCPWSLCSPPPGVQKVIPWADFFHTAFIVHVDLTVLVWFLAFAGVFWRLNCAGSMRFGINTALTAAAIAQNDSKKCLRRCGSQEKLNTICGSSSECC